MLQIIDMHYRCNTTGHVICALLVDNKSHITCLKQYTLQNTLKGSNLIEMWTM